MRRVAIALILFFGTFAVFNSKLSAADPKIEEQIIAPPNQPATYILSERGLHVAVVGRSGSRMKVTVDGVEGPILDQMLLPNGGGYGSANTVGVSAIGDINLPVLFSPSGDHYAYAGRIGDNVVIIHDGKEIARRGPYNASVLNFGPICFSPEGKHLFFILTDVAAGGKQQFIMDGKPLSIKPQQTPPGVMFSPDDSHYAYYGMTEDRKKSILVLDGKDSGYDGDEPHFSADNKLVVMGTINNKRVVLVDGKPLNHGEGVQRFVISKTGNRIITVNTRANPGGQLYYLVVDGKKVDDSECLMDITKIVFSPDGKRYMARCVGQGTMWMVIDGKKELSYNGIGDDFGFSADSSKYAYLASAGAGQFMIVDGKEIEAGVMTAKPIFSPKGSRLAYVTGVNRLQMQVTVDGKIEPVTRDVTGVVFSPDGSRYAYQANTMQSPSLNVDGVQQEGLLAGTFAFSPDSKHVVVTGQRSKDAVNGLFMDNQLVYRQAGRFVRQLFSPDSKHFYLSAVETAQPPRVGVYVDGKPIAKYDMNANAVFEQMPESWDISADGVATYLAFTPEGLKKVRVTPAADSNVETMVADVKAAEEKAIADAAQAKADADAAKAKAAADAQKAREDAAAARAKQQQDTAAARAKARNDAAAARAARRGGATPPPNPGQ